MTSNTWLEFILTHLYNSLQVLTQLLGAELEAKHGEMGGVHLIQQHGARRSVHEDEQHPPGQLFYIAVIDQ